MGRSQAPGWITFEAEYIKAKFQTEEFRLYAKVDKWIIPNLFNILYATHHWMSSKESITVFSGLIAYTGPGHSKAEDNLKDVSKFFFTKTLVPVSLI